VRSLSMFSQAVGLFPYTSIYKSTYSTADPLQAPGDADEGVSRRLAHDNLFSYICRPLFMYVYVSFLICIYKSTYSTADSMSVPGDTNEGASRRLAQDGRFSYIFRPLFMYM